MIKLLQGTLMLSMCITALMALPAIDGSTDDESDQMELRGRPKMDSIWSPGSLVDSLSLMSDSSSDADEPSSIIADISSSDGGDSPLPPRVRRQGGAFVQGAYHYNRNLCSGSGSRQPRRRRRPTSRRHRVVLA